MRKIFILLFVLLPEISIVRSQTFKTVKMEFTRTIERDNRQETSSGSIYYNSTKTILKITEPIIQWILMTGDSLLIYYPNEKQALLMKCENPATLPFLNMFVGVVKENFGLGELGYGIIKNEMKGDTLFTYWAPPTTRRKFMGPVVLALLKNKLVLSESQNPQGKTILKTIYQNHISYRTKNFPLQMTVFQFSEQGTIIENVTFVNPLFDQPFPIEIENFCIPQDVIPEEIEW